MTDASNLAGLVEKVNEIRDASPAEWDAARRLVARTAPDCADVLFGIQQSREKDQRAREDRAPWRGVR
jgi:hypothetical protein